MWSNLTGHADGSREDYRATAREIGFGTAREVVGEGVHGVGEKAGAKSGKKHGEVGGTNCAEKTHVRRGDETSVDRHAFGGGDKVVAKIGLDCLVLVVRRARVGKERLGKREENKEERETTKERQEKNKRKTREKQEKNKRKTREKQEKRGEKQDGRKKQKREKQNREEEKEREKKKRQKNSHLITDPNPRHKNGMASLPRHQPFKNPFAAATCRIATHPDAPWAVHDAHDSPLLVAAVAVVRVGLAAARKVFSVASVRMAENCDRIPTT